MTVMITAVGIDSNAEAWDQTPGVSASQADRRWYLVYRCKLSNEEVDDQQKLCINIRLGFPDTGLRFRNALHGRTGGDTAFS